MLSDFGDLFGDNIEGCTQHSSSCSKYRPKSDLVLACLLSDFEDALFPPEPRPPESVPHFAQVILVKVAPPVERTAESVSQIAL